MQFLKILFWCLLTFVAALFTYGNWFPVPIHLWNNLIAETNLPALLLFTFLLGLLPTLIYQHAIRWRLRQRLATAERTITGLRAVTVPGEAVSEVLPERSVLTAVPPGGA